MDRMSQVNIEEAYLTVNEVAERLKVNEETVRRIFLNEPGVLVICFPRKGRRVYRTLRIPLGVFQRVLTRFTKLSS
jgi:hypothetical protein